MSKEPMPAKTPVEACGNLARVDGGTNGGAWMSSIDGLG